MSLSIQSAGDGAAPGSEASEHRLIAPAAAATAGLLAALDALHGRLAGLARKANQLDALLFSVEAESSDFANVDGLNRASYLLTLARELSSDISTEMDAQALVALRTVLSEGDRLQGAQR